MANLIIKPTSGGLLKLQEDGGTDAISIGTDGKSTITNAIITAWTPPAGTVLQVVSATKTAHQSSASTNNAFTAITDLDLAITPSATSSKVLVTYHINVSQSTGSHTGVGIALYRGGSILTAATGASTSNNRTRVTSGVIHYNTNDGNAYSGTLSMTFLDSPSTTSATTYQPYLYNASGSAFTSYVNRDQGGTNNLYASNAISTITCMEIKG